MYKIRDGVELPKTFKIRVTPEQSEALQKYLFSKGGSWMSGQTEVGFTDIPFIYVYNNKLAYGRTPMFFRSEVLPEIRFSDYFEQDCKKVASASTKINKFLAENTDFVKSFTIKPNSCGFTDYKVEVGGEIVLGCFREDDDKAAETFIARIKEHFVTDTAIDVALKFLQKHNTKISTEVYRKCGGDELEIKAELKERGVHTRFEVTLSGKEIGKANTFISTVSSVLGLNPVGLKAHELARENAILRSDLETARKFDREYYRNRLSELRKTLRELRERITSTNEKPKVKWCVLVSPKNKAQLNAYLQKNASKYEGFNEKWEVETDGLYFYSESPVNGFHSSQNLYPGFVRIKNKNLKHYI